MAHSFKKNAAGGYAEAFSEKKDKRIWHKRLRTVELQKLSVVNKDEEIIMPIVHEVSDPWTMNKDGKHIYFTPSSVRKEINGFISGLMNSSDKELFFKNNDHWVIKEFCEYFKIKKVSNKILYITDKQKEKFVIYFTKKNTKK